MKKVWNAPVIETLEVSNTEHSACPATRADNTYGGFQDFGQVCES